MTTTALATHARLTPAVHRSAYIRGAWVLADGPGETVVVNPATEETVSTVAFASTAQVEEAVRAAREAFWGPWSTFSPIERSNRIHMLADLMESNQQELAGISQTENGSPNAEALIAQVLGPVRIFRWFAEAARRGPQGGIEFGLPLDDSTVMSASMLRREPAGVVAAITAYNFPLVLAARKLGPALAAGCTAVLMPSERTPLTTLRLFELLDEVDLPPGVVNLVVGSKDAGQILSTHPMVDMVSFTGSVQVGAQIMAQAAATTKKVVLELGGKSPAIILAGAKIEDLIKPATDRYIVAAGQACGCTTRTFIPNSLYADYVDATKEYLESAVVVGDPGDDRTTMGPLIRDSQRAMVEGFVDRAVNLGADVLAGGGRPSEMSRGYFLNPLLLGGVHNDSEIARNELFGPVGLLMPYDDVEEAIGLANDTPFGLSGAVWGPTDEAIRVARRVRSGSVLINGGGGARPDTPWGGPGVSGLGREQGEEGFLEYFETKHIQWPLVPPGRRP